MRAALISGVVLAVVGLFVLLKGVNYTRQESVLKVGGFEAKVRQEHRVPDWVGGLALGAGGVLIGFGVWKRGTAKRR
jgi:hypothetical protein